MSEEYDEIKLYTQKTTSLLKVFVNTISGNLLKREDYDTIDDFLGENNQNAKRAMSLYWEAVSELSSDISSEETLEFVNFMTNALICIAAQKNRRVMEVYKDDFNELLETTLQSRVLDIMNSDNTTKLSPNKMDYIQKAIQVWTTIDASLIHIDTFNSFKARMENNGTPLANDVEYSYFLNYATKHILMVEKGQAKKAKPPKITEETEEDLLQAVMFNHEQNWLEYFIKKLRTGDVDAVWKDDIIMVMLQMLDSGAYKDSELVRNNQDRIHNVRESFANRDAFSDDKIREAFAVMNQIVKKYRDIEIDDPDVIKKLANAYKIVYLKEKISNPQTPPVKYSEDYARFIIMQMNAFKKYSEKNDLDWELLIKRASIDLALKEEDKMMHEKYENVEKNSVIALVKPNGFFDNTMGNVMRLNNRAIFTFGDPFAIWCKTGLNMIRVIGHENTHIVSGNFNFSSKDIDFDSYMEHKTLLSAKYIPMILNINYEVLYFEIRAQIGEIIAQLETFKKFQITDDREYWGDIIDGLKNKYLGCVYKSLTDKIRVSPIDEKEEYAVKVFDDVFKENFKQIKTSSKSTPLRDIFAFEFKEDATPKTFDEIIKDQENEMKTGILVPTSGPQKPLDRMIFRMRMMMYRAIAYGKENEFVDAMNNFLINNHDDLYKYDFFNILFPQGKVPTEEKSQEIFEALFDEGKEYGLTEFAYGIYKINERVRLKKASQFDEEKETFFNDYVNTIISRWNAYTLFRRDAKIRLNTDMHTFEEYTITQ